MKASFSHQLPAHLLIKLKPPVLGAKDIPSPHMYDMIRVHCRNLVTVNDSYGPPIPYME